MNVLNDERIGYLVEHRSPLSVSLFMPTHRTGRERGQDRIRLKNLIGQAREKMLGQMDFTVPVDEVLQPASDIPSSEGLWRHRSEGLACFCAEDFFRAYRVPIRLEEQVIVNDRFHIRPLLPLLRSDARLYILTLTQEAAALWEATRYSIREIELPEIDQVKADGDEQLLQYHAHKAPAHGKGSTEAAIYHGHGGPADRTKKDALRFFQLVDREVTRVLRGRRAPLVLACVGYLASLYESANSYRHLLKGKIPGSPDRWSQDELRDHAWEIVEPHFQQSQRLAWKEFQNALGTQRASGELREVVLAADQGRVSTLFLARDEERWGHVDPQRQSVHAAAGTQPAEELLDYAVTRTLSNGGEVYVLDTLPNTDSPVAATFRY